jgi:hypothetical protein
VPLHAIGWEPSYGGQAVTRETWPQVPDGHRRVIRETSEVARRVADGSYAPALKRDSAWGDTEEVRPERAAPTARALYAPGLASGWSLDIVTRTAG